MTETYSHYVVVVRVLLVELGKTVSPLRIKLIATAMIFTERWIVNYRIQNRVLTKKGCQII